MTQGYVLLTHLPRELAPAAKRAGKPAPTYARCYRAVLDGTIPAEKVGREWQVADVDLPTVERVLGLTSMQAASACAA